MQTVDTAASQGASVAAWDVTVRSSSQASTTDLPGRVFANYLSLYTGGNQRPLYCQVYAATTDGYQYKISLGGLDPNGFIMYADQVGFKDSDSVSPLYHDVVGDNGQLANMQGGCALSVPTYPLFFNTPDSGALFADGIATSPIAPVISAVSFTGTGGSGGSNARLGNGGSFHFTSNVRAVYQIVLSRDGTNFDPTNLSNRVLRGLLPSGANTVPWDGKDNSGANFPVGTNYLFHSVIHGGEYHFPLLDAENSLQGGPSFQLMNASNPLGNTHAFYDDRGYRTLSGFNVTSDSVYGTSGSASKVNQVLGGLAPPNPPASDPAAGFDTAASQRAYGQNAQNPNTNTLNTGSFGDTKGLDLWTYFPSSTDQHALNVEGTPRLLLVKRITAINGTAVNGFADDPGTTDDNSPYWPAPAATYLRGGLSGLAVKPGDIVEYTIYYVCTQGPVTNFTLCDLLPSGTTFQTGTYTAMTPGDGGTAGAPSGIALASSASALPTAPTSYLTNSADAPDRGQFYLPGTSAPAAANSASGFTQPLPAVSNTNGVVGVSIVAGAAALPSATGAGTPTNSYGFVRFQVVVN